MFFSWCRYCMLFRLLDLLTIEYNCLSNHHYYTNLWNIIATNYDYYLLSVDFHYWSFLESLKHIDWYRLFLIKCICFCNHTWAQLVQISNKSCKIYWSIWPVNVLRNYQFHFKMNNNGILVRLIFIIYWIDIENKSALLQS